MLQTSDLLTTLIERRTLDDMASTGEAVYRQTAQGYQLLRWCALGLFWVFALALASQVTALYFLGPQPVGIDAHAYWLAGRTVHPYGAAPGVPDAFLYSPVFAQLMRPLAVVPWPVFIGAWMTVEAAVFAWLVRPLPAHWAIPLWLICLPEIALGNIVGFLCLAAVIGVQGRGAGAWAFGYLTKIVPGGLGTVWALARRDWRALASIGAVTGALAVASFALDPSLWGEWVAFLRGHGGGSGGAWVLARTLCGCVLVVIGARTGRAWLMAPALILATPVLLHIEVIAYLAAVPRLAGHAARRCRV